MQQSSYRSVFRGGLFADRTYIVTGAGSGIGRCIAHELAALGANVALVGRRLEKLETVAAELATTGGKISAHCCDLRMAEKVNEIVQAILEQHGHLEGLVNNAGGQFPALLEDMSVNGWDAVIRNNLHAPFIISQACFRSWFKRHGGAIVTVLADIWGSMPVMGHSGAARAGAKSFTETAAVEWASAGVRVNAVAPGWIQSSGLDTYPAHYQAEIAKWPQLVPLQRLGTESEVSAAIVFLLSEAASFITGTTLRIDGGVPNVRPHWPAKPGRSTPAFDGFVSEVLDPISVRSSRSE
jgi:citronellol/citronellal dehydrogenase